MRTAAACVVLMLGSGLAEAGPVQDCNDPRDPGRQLRGCSAYIRTGKGEPADRAVAHLNRANVYAQRGRYSQAFADYASALALDPANPLILYNRGNAYFDLKQYQRAAADFTRAVQLDPRFGLAYYNRGLALERLGDATAAAEDYRRALTFDTASALAQKALERLQSQ
ncbi:MAG TPA: tetratricopeptide repeat protein [Hyphomicrobiaceae bacterium]|jgi:tetratricopeptide (TPR) repeat protein|nr:tetratricopeptide repeat protein [Hyphomicrobiaceae bacterium]